MLCQSSEVPRTRLSHDSVVAALMPPSQEQIPNFSDNKLIRYQNTDDKPIRDCFMDQFYASIKHFISSLLLEFAFLTLGFKDKKLVINEAINQVHHKHFLDHRFTLNYFNKTIANMSRYLPLFITSFSGHQSALDRTCQESKRRDWMSS